MKTKPILSKVTFGFGEFGIFESLYRHIDCEETTEQPTKTILVERDDGISTMERAEFLCARAFRALRLPGRERPSPKTHTHAQPMKAV
jgi:hypothetical protein